MKRLPVLALLGIADAQHGPAKTQLADDPSNSIVADARKRGAHGVIPPLRSDLLDAPPDRLRARLCVSSVGKTSMGSEGRSPPADEVQMDWVISGLAALCDTKKSPLSYKGPCRSVEETNADNFF
jgi:hypothetical protein